MSRSPTPLKQVDLTRYVKAVRAAGIPVGKVTVSPDGTVNLYSIEGEADNQTPNPCDRLLK